MDIFKNRITLYPRWSKGGEPSVALKLHTFNWLIYGFDYIEVFFFPLHYKVVEHDL